MTVAASLSGEVILKEIPVPLVKANQIMFVLGSVLGLVLQNPWIILSLFIISIASLLFGPRANLAFRIVRPILSHRLFYAPTESVELQRFNQIIAVTCFFLGSVCLLLFQTWAGWIFVGMIIAAATLALCGFCVGCLIYFPYKMRLREMRAAYPRLGVLFDFIAGTGRFRPPLQEKYQPLMIMGFAHESVRHWLGKIEKQTLLAQDQSALALLQDDIRFLVKNIEHHAIQEDERMYPPIDAKSKGITLQFEAEHEEGHHIQEEMFACISGALAGQHRLEAAREAVLKWTRFNAGHLRHEEKILMPLLPGMFSYEEGLRIARHILDINHEDYLDYHISFVFEGLKPGQRYAYVSLLSECSTSEQFAAYEELLRPMVPGEAWNDFTLAGRMVSY